MDNVRIIANEKQNFALVNPPTENDCSSYPYFRDKLTGLANRELFLRHLNRSVALAKKQKNNIFAIFILNIDRFRNINNRFGYEIGDKLLSAVSRRLENCLDSKDTIARVGSDEFAILLENIKDVDRAISIAERVAEELMSPFHLDRHKVFAKVSIGIALSTSNYEQPEELLRQADTAMCHAKRIGGSSYQVFNDSTFVQAMKLLRIENDLQRAIERQEFHLHYQPIVSLQTRKIIGFEALLRWEHLELGMISPSDFIPLAEETRSIIPLGWWVLREACRQTREWQLQFPHLSDLTISVNISGIQLSQTNFIEQVKQVLQETELDPRSLKLEFTESVLIENTQSIINILKELQEIGVQFSLDDFGTGYSSLSYLHQFSFNTLKIDRSFIRSMEINTEKLVIVRAIVALAVILGMDVVAEGIEKNSQLAQLKVLKCQYGQGYLFSKGLDSKAASALMSSEFAKEDELKTENLKQIIEEQLSKEQLLLQIESMRQEIEELQQDKVDLEIMLDTTTEHAQIVELELEEEITNYQKINQELKTLSRLDCLTQIANRHYFEDYLNQKWYDLAQKQQPLSLILADVDYFRRYNDEYGHQQGNDCLIMVARAMSRLVKPPVDLVARYEGEKFALILPNTGTEGALKIAEGIRLELKRRKLVHAQSSVSFYVTLSLGIASQTPLLEASPQSLVILADKALNQAKHQGRDRAHFSL